MFAVATLALALAQAHLAVPTTNPFTVRGSGFRAGERVALVVRAHNRLAKTVTAGSRGRFRARMPRVRLGTCGAFIVRASGSMGGRAVLRVMPECPQP